MKYKNIIITAAIVIAAANAYQQPVSLVRAAENGKPDSTTRLDTAKPGITHGVDPCNGTGGTGQIVSVGNNIITIKRNDGKNEVIYLTDKTTIKNSAGSLPQSDLKKGDRVTVVVMSHHTATVVLVCSTSGSKPVK